MCRFSNHHTNKTTSVFSMQSASSCPFNLPPKATPFKVQKALPTKKSNNINKRSFGERKVCFNLDKNSNAAPVGEISLGRAANTWYSTNEIRSFKAQVKALVSKGLPSNEEIFGMERYAWDRQSSRKKIVKYVFLSQKINRDPEFQNYISRRRSSAYKEMALNQALENFCEVYDPLSSLLGDGSNDEGDNYNDYFFSCSNDTYKNGKSAKTDISFNIAMIDHDATITRTSTTIGKKRHHHNLQYC